MVLDGTGSVYDDTGWYLVSISWYCLVLGGTGSAKGLYSCIYWTKWRFGLVLLMPHSQTDRQQNIVLLSLSNVQSLSWVTQKEHSSFILTVAVVRYEACEEQWLDLQRPEVKSLDWGNNVTIKTARRSKFCIGITQFKDQKFCNDFAIITIQRFAIW